MAHQHAHNHTHDHPPGGDIKVAFFLNFVFTIVEFIGGILTNSVAILSDAFHDLGDSISLGLAWYFENLSKKKKTSGYSYGYRRFSLAGALINAVILSIGSVIILREAIPRFFNPQMVKVEGMIALGVLGIIFNGIAALRLKNRGSINQKVVYLHLLEDVLGWIAVLLGALIMYFVDAPFIDPLLSVLISGYILFNVFRNLKAIVKIVMQGTPAETDLAAIDHYFSQAPEIDGYHDLHVWSLDGQYHVLTVHLIVDGAIDRNKLIQLKLKIREDLRQMGIEHATLEFETDREECLLVDC
jgi:cobalt-zinc-cadmium efflux system protein